MFLPLLFYFRLFNNPYIAILREGYFFPDSNSEFMSEFAVFTSFFFTFELFTCPTRRRGSDGLAPVGGFPGVGDARGVELGYFDDWGGR